MRTDASPGRLLPVLHRSAQNMRAIRPREYRRFLLDVSDSYVILPLTICDFVGHDLNFRSRTKQGNCSALTASVADVGFGVDLQFGN